MAHAVKAHLGAFETCADSTRIPQSRWTMAVLLPLLSGGQYASSQPLSSKPTGGGLPSSGASSLRGLGSARGDCSDVHRGSRGRPAHRASTRSASGQADRAGNPRARIKRPGTLR